MNEHKIKSNHHQLITNCNFPSNRLFISFIVFSFLFILNKAHSEESTKDSVLKKFPEVTVTAKRVADTTGIKFSPVAVFEREQIQLTGARQVSDAIIYQPGIYIKDYGGLGGLKTISLRGTASGQTLMMLDGMKINSSQNGTVDLSSMPMNSLKAIEIARGGNSALYGSNSIAGAVNLLTDFGSDKPEARCNLFFGSFSEFSSAIEGSIPLAGMNINASANYISTKGNYPFETSQYGNNQTNIRQNADFKNLSATIGGKYSDTTVENLTRILIRSTDRGTPGAVVQGNVETSNSRVNEKDILFYNKSTFSLLDKSALAVGLSGRVNDLEYVDPEFLGVVNGKYRTFFNSRDIQLQLKSLTDFTFFQATLGFESSFSDLKGNMLQKEAGGYVKRSAYALSCLLIKNFGNVSFFNLSMQAGIRYDDISDAGHALSPVAGLIIEPSGIPLKLTSQVSGNFRAPSFNEMYYFNYGTPNLKPEKGLSFNTGANWQIFSKTELEINYFSISTRDQIVSVPNSPISWNTGNINSVLTRGIELSVFSNLFTDLINIRFNYTLQKSTDESAGSLTQRKDIPYIPQEIISSVISTNFLDFTQGADLQYSSFRYSMPDNSYASVLPSYISINLFITKTVSLYNTRVTFRAECNNLTDSQYSIIKNYPLPGRFFRAGMLFYM